MKSRRKNGVIVIEGHVQGLANTRAIGKHGIPVIVVDKRSCLAASSKYCSDFFQCPDFLEDRFVDFLIELAQGQGLQDWVLLPSNDHAVFTISKHLNKVTKYFKTTIPNVDIINQIYDKANLLQLALQVDVPIPATYYFSSIKDVEHLTIPYPALTKGKTGLSFYKSLGKKAFLSKNLKELVQDLNLIKNKVPLNETFTQELIPFDGTNKTISLAAFCENGDVKSYWMGVKLREHPVQFGTATFTESVYEENVLKYSKRILKALNYNGVCEVEFLKDPRDGDFKLIEINARTWLWVGHAIANGVNFPLYTYQSLSGEEVEYAESYSIGLKWRNPYTDFIFTTTGLLKNKLRFKKVISENKGKVVNALWEKNDPKPFYRYAYLMLSFLKNR